MRIAVFGLGYVGCVSAACLARAGHEVTGVDINPDKVSLINAAVPPVVEPGLKELLAEVVPAGRLRAVSSAAEAVAATDLALVCVGTPSRPSGQLDVEALARTAEDIGRALASRTRPYTVVLRSTVLPGTAHAVLVPALEGQGERRAPARVAVNPEFMREGSALRDFARPPMILVGCDDARTGELVESLYAGIDAPVVRTGVRNAEMVKYASNAFHALKVCFANEVGDVCQALGADQQEVMRIFRMDRALNVSEAYLRPGYAFGGSCLPKDVRALLHAAGRADVPTPVLAGILPSNDAQVRRAVDAVLATRKKRIGVVGLAFKPGTDDLRESPMVTLVEALIGKGCNVRILDRSVSIARLVGANRRYIEEEIPHIASLMCESADALLGHAEVLVVGAACEEAERVLADAGPGHQVVDLTRSAVRRRSTATAEA